MIYKIKIMPDVNKNIYYLYVKPPDKVDFHSVQRVAPSIFCDRFFQ